MTKQTQVRSTKEVLKLALGVLVQHVEHFDYEQFTSICELDPAKDAITAIREALAEESSGTEQPAPVAWFPPAPPPECKSEAEKTAFAFGWFKALEAQRYTSPPTLSLAQRKPKTEEFIKHAWANSAPNIGFGEFLSLFRAIEAVHGIKGETK